MDYDYPETQFFSLYIYFQKGWLDHRKEIWSASVRSIPKAEDIPDGTEFSAIRHTGGATSGTFFFFNLAFRNTESSFRIHFEMGEIKFYIY
jgi:hypothetical protein